MHSYFLVKRLDYNSIKHSIIILAMCIIIFAVTEPSGIYIQAAYRTTYIGITIFLTR